MSTIQVQEGVTPASCDHDVFQKGVSVAQIAQGSGMRSWHIEAFIRSVAHSTQTRTDWHYSGGIAQVLTLDDPEKVAAEVQRAWGEFAAPYPNAQMMTGLPARYRAGVDTCPAT